MKEETRKTHVRGTIKPLVWRTKAPQLDEYNPAKSYASGMGGRYCVDSTGGDALLWDAADPTSWTQYKTAKEAKSAAQADYEARIVAQIQPDAEPIGWQPIETAPRDGTPFLAYGGPEVYECWFVNDPHEGSYLQDHADSEPNPTHWMPRPADPPRPIRAQIEPDPEAQPQRDPTSPFAPLEKPGWTEPEAQPVASSDAGELADAISELRGIVQCQCNKSYTDRGMHSPDCKYYAAVSLDTIIRALPAARAGVSAAEAARVLLDRMGDDWDRAVNAMTPILWDDQDETAWNTVSEMRDAFIAALRALTEAGE